MNLDPVVFISPMPLVFRPIPVYELAGSLHSHKLKGELAGAWTCTVDYDNRILFEFAQNPESGEEEILLLTMGTHNEIY